jgi:hypothetical protein
MIFKIFFFFTYQLFIFEISNNSNNILYKYESFVYGLTLLLLK